MQPHRGRLVPEHLRDLGREMVDLVRVGLDAAQVLDQLQRLVDPAAAKQCPRSPQRNGRKAFAAKEGLEGALGLRPGQIDPAEVSAHDTELWVELEGLLDGGPRLVETAGEVGVQTQILVRADEQGIQIDRLLAELELLDKRKQKGATLSGGERRRVEITRALVLEPRFMLLDEPFSGIDPIAVIDIQKIIAQLRERGIGIVITDHNVRETLSICDRAYIIKDGRIIREGTPAEITEDPTVREIYLGQDFRL